MAPSAVRTWFIQLSGGGKLLVVMSVGVLGLAIVSIVLQVIVWSIQLAMLGILVFLGYRFFIRSQPSSR